ncbi:MAG: amidohydrolase [Chloroflexi bacterium]|nr:amidohydrolase [Chloroflexota bacterium]
MEIVDAQVHLNNLTPPEDIDAMIQTAVTTMNAVGVDTVFIAETRGYDKDMRPLGATIRENGAIRMDMPYSERAMELHPKRFGWLARVDRRDPELDRMVGDVRKKTGALALRIVPIPDTGETKKLEDGEYEPFFAACEEHQVPVFCWLPGRSHLIVPYLKKFPRLQFILDHCGVGQAPYTIGQTAPTLVSSVVERLEDRVAQLGPVLELAQYPNLAMKWCHSPSTLSGEAYPYRDMQKHLRRAVDAFGPDRIMWASDYTQSRVETGTSWGDTLYWLRDSDVVSEPEKEWLLGKSVRKALRWEKE